MDIAKTVTRRTILQAGAVAAVGVSGFVPTRFAIGNTAKVKVGFLLPYTGTYAGLGEAITNAFKLAVEERGGKMGGREIQYVAVDSEANPAKGPENTNKLVTGENVDFLVGPVHSGVALGMVKVVRESGTITVIANAGAGAATGPLCAPNIFRTSFTNWQASYPMGKVAVERGLKNVVTMSWKYAAGEEALAGFEANFTKHGGKVVKQIMVPFPSDEFQANLTEIASLKPDGVFVFFAGAGALKFVKDYAAAGLKSIQLMGSGFLTDGVLKGQGEAAEGVLTTLHYADALDTPENKAFRAAYSKSFGKEADVYAVQGYDAAQLLVQGMAAVKGDTGAKPALIDAMEKAVIKSPRGTFTLSKAHNPVQDFYLRQVKGGQEIVVGVAEKALADPATGCKMG
ncbi:ABC transporter substrate-binding protein [Magnetospirillum sp. SS-4]|uniref:ABC transporter substrate-binding protein n=1 Tax=Magnetospirillum sp. SS-4 TaxID=2681465 RepID=UPI0013860F93|nr:ABC transporter substrate-binding protein [Magnetospirillum sp. SS-4]CAA7622203.1 ABC-type branched-chain amino acid transport system protein [Magnetospirillum sp. SS-4]